MLAHSRSRRSGSSCSTCKRGEHAGGVRGRQRGREDERPAVVLEIVDDALRRRDEAADGGERLGEGAGDDVHLFGHAEVGRGAVAVRDPARRGRGRRRGPAPRRTSGPPATSPGTSAMLPSMEYTPSTTIMAPLPLGAVPLEPALQVGEVAVIEALGLAVGQLGAIHDRGMVQLVEVDTSHRGRPGPRSAPGWRSSRWRRRGRPPCPGTPPGRSPAARAGPAFRSGTGCRCSRSRSGAAPARPPRGPSGDGSGPR